MTRPSVSRYPVSSFGPELLAILLKGARERVEIRCPNQRHMQHLQMRLQMLRGAMGRENHPNYALVTRARTSRTWGTDKDTDCVLVVQPNDIEFAEAARAAGVTVTVERDLLNDTLNESMAEREALDESPPIDPYAKWKGV